MTAVLSQTIAFLKKLCRYRFKILRSYFEQSVHKYSTQSYVFLLQSYFEFRLFFFCVLIQMLATLIIHHVIFFLNFTEMINRRIYKVKHISLTCLLLQIFLQNFENCLTIYCCTHVFLP